jgi:hypothetical protein
MVAVIIILPPFKQAYKGPTRLQEGGGMKVKPVLMAVPLGLVTLTEPVDPLPTTAVRVVELTIINDVAATLPNETAVTLPLSKFVPVMVIVCPWAADVGVKLAIVGVAAKTP